MYPSGTAIVNAVTVVILAFVNIYYLKIASDQTKAANIQARESQRQADVAMENLKLAKAQAEQQAAQELTTTIAILRGIAVDVAFWLRSYGTEEDSSVYCAPRSARLASHRVPRQPGLARTPREGPCNP